MRTAVLAAGATPLVAAAADDDDAATVTAYDSRGGARHISSARQAPDRPVYVIDVDVTKAMSAGLALVGEQFAKAGLSSPAVAAVPSRGAPAAQAATGGFSDHPGDLCYLNHDEEPRSSATPRSSRSSAASASTARCASTRRHAVPRRRPQDVLPKHT